MKHDPGRYRLYITLRRTPDCPHRITRAKITIFLHAEYYLEIRSMDLYISLGSQTRKARLLRQPVLVHRRASSVMHVEGSECLNVSLVDVPDHTLRSSHYSTNALSTASGNPPSELRVLVSTL